MLLYAICFSHDEKRHWRLWTVGCGAAFQRAGRLSWQSGRFKNVADWRRQVRRRVWQRLAAPELPKSAASADARSGRTRRRLLGAVVVALAVGAGHAGGVFETGVGGPREIAGNFGAALPRRAKMPGLAKGGPAFPGRSIPSPPLTSSNITAIWRGRTKPPSAGLPCWRMMSSRSPAGASNAATCCPRKMPPAAWTHTTNGPPRTNTLWPSRSSAREPRGRELSCAKIRRRCRCFARGRKLTLAASVAAAFPAADCARCTWPD